MEDVKVPVFEGSLQMEKIPKLNSAKISPLLKELREDGIITTEPIPKDEKIGRGPGGDRHWLVESYENFFRTFDMLWKNFSLEKTIFESIGISTMIVVTSDPFGQKFMNEGLFNTIESKLQVTLDIRITEYLLQIIKKSPSTLYHLNIFQRIIDELIKHEKRPYEILNYFLIALTDAFMSEINDRFYMLMNDNEQFEVKNIIFFNDSKEKYVIETDIDHSYLGNNVFKHKIKINKVESDDFEKLLEKVNINS